MRHLRITHLNEQCFSLGGYIVMNEKVSHFAPAYPKIWQEKRQCFMANDESRFSNMSNQKQLITVDVNDKF